MSPPQPPSPRSAAHPKPVPAHEPKQTPKPVGGPRDRSARDPDFSREEIVARMAAGPGEVARMVAGRTDEWLRTPPSEGEWSVLEILAHLRACDDAWGSGIRAILAADRPAFRAVNPRTLIRATNYRDLSFAESFAGYAATRQALVSLLADLPLPGWSRSAIVTGAGAVLERTVHWYAIGIPAHERSHLRQIGRLTRG